MNYTKGGWIADNGDSELWGIFQKEDSKAIAYLCEPSGKLLRESEAEANAHLIASAPSLHKELSNLVSRIEQGLALGEKLDLAPARQALAKVEK